MTQLSEYIHYVTPLPYNRPTTDPLPYYKIFRIGIHGLQNNSQLVQDHELTGTILPMYSIHAFTILYWFKITSQTMSSYCKIIIYECHPESKEPLRIQSAHLFCCSRSMVFGVQCDVEKLSHALVRRSLSRGKCRDNCWLLFRTVQTWHRRTFSCFQTWWSTLLVNASQMMKTRRMLIE